MSIFDLDFVQHHVEHLLTNGLYRGREKGNEDLYNQQAAFVSALIVAYGRIFTRSKGLPKFPVALTHYDDEEMKLHDKLMKDRHKLYAHSDSESFRILTSQNTIIRMLPPYHLRQVELEQVRAMADKLRKSIVDRINEMDASSNRM
jgi:hypothetical protein